MPLDSRKPFDSSNPLSKSSQHTPSPPLQQNPGYKLGDVISG
ncbi:uncharacterized protein PAC_16862 [Phialocephala subalpina]|uniref:Uncharacterized protein n=1 Tax=Phialocephala subalpina TaxID=576137 RepID=A0A1L7XPL4_9HELO|nr:uncharacterized protein PAC_16862 [Phialocephala subalpina]